MKIAIISDIHANLEALNKVLEDIKNRNIDKIYCLGDIITKGIHNQECVDIVKKKCEVIIRGNCEDFHASEVDIDTLSPEVRIQYEFIQKNINKETKLYLRNLPYCYEFYLSGRLVRLLHAHPQDITKHVISLDKLSLQYELFLPSDKTISQERADIVIIGHNHIPFIQKIYNRYIINPGSVGNPLDIIRDGKKDGNPKFTTVANYLILSGNLDSKDVNDKISFELVSVPYDIDKVIKENKGVIEYDSYIAELKEGNYRDDTALKRALQERGIEIDDK